MTIVEPRNRRWTYEEYYQMADMGFFRGQRVELIDGEIVEMEPQGNSHAMTVGLCQEVLRRVFTTGYWIREQLPLRFDAHHAEPEPDLSVVVGGPRDYADGHPSMATLIVEVSETTLDYDRGRKANLYASAGVQDYWILNLKERQLERFRSPIADSTQPFGWRYAETDVFKPTDTISALAASDESIRVAELMP